MDWNNIISSLGRRAYFPIILFLIGVLFCAIAMLQSAPLPSNGFKLDPRPEIHLPLTLLGTGLILSSILIFFFMRNDEKVPQPSSSPSGVGHTGGNIVSSPPIAPLPTIDSPGEDLATAIE